MHSRANSKKSISISLQQVADFQVDDDETARGLVGDLWISKAAPCWRLIIMLFHTVYK